MPPSDQARWFSEEVQPYEPALRAYLSKRFPSLPDHDDLVQETYARTLRAREKGRLTYVKAFLFTAARNAAIDLIRRRHRRPYDPLPDDDTVQVIDQAPDVVDTLERQQRIDAVIEAIVALPDRCREAMMLRYLDGLSPREIAERLGISQETVKVHMVRGVRSCTRFFHQRGLLETVEPLQRIAS